MLVTLDHQRTKKMIRKRIFWLALLTLCISNFLVAQTNTKIRLNDNWKFLRSDLGGIWEAVRPVKEGNPESVPLWESITLPHCFNAIDAVDPDVNYYQGPGWYSSQIEISNPIENGRTLLHFEGAGQKTEVYVYLTKVGSHVGGYNEWSVDITDAVKISFRTMLPQNPLKGKSQSLFAVTTPGIWK